MYTQVIYEYQGPIWCGSDKTSNDVGRIVTLLVLNNITDYQNISLANWNIEI